MRPAAFVVKLCRMFPETEFRILTETADKKSPKKGIDPKELMQLQFGQFYDGDEVTVEVQGKCEIMASEFLKVVWENLLDYSDDVPAAKVRLTRLIDETFNRIYDPDIEAAGGELPVAVNKAELAPADEECRSVATINDRLHNLSLPMILLISKHFQSRLQISFEVPLQGIFTFTLEPQSAHASEERILEHILELPIEVGTRITVLTRGQNRVRANESVKTVLQNLWQCDEWLRNRTEGFESQKTILELLEFAEKVGSAQSPEYGTIQNPYISNQLTNQHVFINADQSEFSKNEVLSQLAAAHARTHRLEFSAVLDRVRDAEKRKSIVLREGFAIAHGAMDRTPRISITFGVYPNGVVWDDTGRRVRLVSMVVFARDTYGTWEDYFRKMAIVFHANPTLQEQLIETKSSGEFRAVLRETETKMIN